MIVTLKSVSVVVTLYDDERNRRIARDHGKYNAMCEDERNLSDADGMIEAVENLVQFGKTYMVTVEEIERD